MAAINSTIDKLPGGGFIIETRKDGVLTVNPTIGGSLTLAQALDQAKTDQGTALSGLTFQRTTIATVAI